MPLLQLPHLAIGAPTPVAVARILQMQLRDLLEPTRRVETRGELVRDSLVVDESVAAGRPVGLLVQAHRIEIATFDAGDLRADQRGAVLEILRAMLGPLSQLPVMRSQC